MKRFMPARPWTVWALLFLSALSAVAAPREVKPGLHLFSKEQDVQLGQEAAAEIEKQVPLLNNPALLNYVKSVGDKLTRQAEAQGYPYTWRLVHDDSINAFALPGGPMFVHTGLISQADNEAQLAGVLGHEIAHIVLRHGTNQASKANFMQLAAALGGAALGGKGIAGDLAAAGIGLGLNGVLLKYSRNAERDADILGLRMMAAAGYNPLEMANFFEKLAGQHGKSSKVATWFSSHPQPQDRSRVIQEEMQYLDRQNFSTNGTGDLGNAQRLVARLGKPPKTANRAGQASGQSPGNTQGNEQMPRFEHSSRMRTFNGNGFSFSYPENWQSAGQDGGVATLIPPGGATGNAIGYGVIARLNPVENNATLGSANEAFVREIMQTNSGLKLRQNPQNLRIDGQPALLTELEGPSPFQGQTERVTILTAAHPQRQLFSLVFIYPQSESDKAVGLAREIARSVRLK